jgi:4-hydroxy-tetrahydrodipicolinate synthase
MATETTLRLAQVPGIVGIKDATANLDRGADLLRRKPASFAVYSGDDATALPYILLGAHGDISVTANVAPRAMHEMCAAALAGDAKRAIALNQRLMGLHQKLFVEANPIPVKWALARMGRIGEGIRLPLTPLAAAHHETVTAALREAGCLS